MKKHIEPHLIELFKQGNPAAFEILYQKLFLPVADYIAKLCDDCDEFGEIVNDSFIKLWQLRQNFETLAHIRAFLFVSSKNNWLDRLRKMQRHKRRQSSLFLSHMLEPITQDNSENSWNVIESILQETQHLSKTSRAIIELAFIGGLKNKQIAKVLGLSEPTIRNQKARALKKLRTRLKGKK